jgi:hypothetical protein
MAYFVCAIVVEEIGCATMSWGRVINLSWVYGYRRTYDMYGGSPKVPSGRPDVVCTTRILLPKNRIIWR